MNIKFQITVYKIKNFLFTWNAESEGEGGSIVFTICKMVHFLKYKDSTLIYFGRNKFKQARKHVEAF